MGELSHPWLRVLWACQALSVASAHRALLFAVPKSQKATLDTRGNPQHLRGPLINGGLHTRSSTY